jgi:hypothetical protein
MTLRWYTSSTCTQLSSTLSTTTCPHQPHLFQAGVLFRTTGAPGREAPISPISAMCAPSPVTGLHTALASTQLTASTHALYTRHMTGHEAQPARRPPRPGSGHHAVAPSRVAHIKYTELFTILYTLNSKAVRYALVTSSSTRTPSAVRCPRTWVTTFPPYLTCACIPNAAQD